MKMLPFALLIATAIFCSTFRNKIDPPPTPLPTPEATLPSTPTISPSPMATKEEGIDLGESNSGEPTVDPTIKSMPGALPLGVLNQTARSLPQPSYPPAARAVRAQGEVRVQILVDKVGKVISASAVSGHPLLRSAAEEAARKASFSPVLVSGEPVTFSGALIYNFVP